MGEKSTKYFLGLEKRNQTRSHIQTIIGSDSEVKRNQSDILSELKSFYSNLYSSHHSHSQNPSNPNNVISQLNIPKLSQDEQNSLEGPITLGEAYKSLISMTKGKTPGNDGLPVEFYIQPRIAGRQWLPGSTFPGHDLPEYLACPKDNKPALYQAVASDVSIETWAERARAMIDEKLHIYGTILFRGLPLNGVDNFSRFVKALRYKNKLYIGGSGQRHEVDELVYTAADNEPPVYTIEPHNEMAYHNDPPMKLLFYCDHPATPGHGGESVVADVRDILPKLNKEVVDKFERLGVRYHNYVGCKNKNDSPRNWQEINDKIKLSLFLENHGYGYRWEDNNSLIFWQNVPAFRRHPLTGERIWFNQITGNHASYCFDHPNFVDLDIPNWKYPYHSTYGDGSEIEPEVIQHIRDVLWQTAVGFQMQKSDVLVYDNMYTQHARIGYTGKRKLVVALTSD
ncbi:dapdiamide synthesis protein DdaC-like [Glandiceps talaboti]